MSPMLHRVIRIGDKSGSTGAILAAMGCPVCFPALASLGAALGLGFLAQWEGFLLTRVLPAAAWLTLAVNALGYFQHRQWHRAALGMTGPAAILLILEFYFATPWRAGAVYAALGLMVIVSLRDIFSPADRRCRAGSTTTTGKRERSRAGPENR